MPTGYRVEGVVEMMLDATLNFRESLTAERLYGWHSALFPTGYSGRTPITVAAWRRDEDGPTLVVSGHPGRETVLYAAPTALHLKSEMAAFLTWFESLTPGDAVIKSANAHLWFVTIHPFDDGNGRIARAIADMALARSEGSPHRFYSMSAQILKQRKSYYDILEHTQKGTVDVTDWVDWYLDCLDKAIDESGGIYGSVIEKARFWDSARGKSINPRQTLILNKLLDNFEGKLTTSKWAKITKCSTDTALRDVQDLIAKGILISGEEGGRSAHYLLLKSQTNGPLFHRNPAEPRA